MRALVTGGRGFIGSHVVDALVADGADVVVYDASPVDGMGGSAALGFASPHVEHLAGDVCDEEALVRAMAGCDAVFHLAALYSFSPRAADAMERVNVGGTRAVLASALRAEVARVVHTSSCATCGPAPGRLATELDHPPAWQMKVAYKRTKVASEQVALDAARAGQDVVVVNPTAPVGPGDRRPTPTGKMVADVVSRRARAYVATAGLNIVDVRDVARGHLLVHRQGRAGERYLLGGENLPLAEVFATVARHAGLPAPRIRVPYRLVHGAAWAAHLAGRATGREPRLLVLDEVRLARLPELFSIEKARTELGYSWRPADDALRDAAAAVRENPVS
jgi:dihydroflavonol-4-reductase